MGPFCITEGGGHQMAPGPGPDQQRTVAGHRWDATRMGVVRWIAPSLMKRHTLWADIAGLRHMRYTTLLFDLDHTLFDFDASEVEAFAAALARAGVEVGDDDHDLFVTINAALWKRVEAGELSPNDVRVVRFEQLVS